MYWFPFHILNHSSTLAWEEDREVGYQHLDPIHRFQVYMLQRPNSPTVAAVFVAAVAVAAAVAGMRLGCMERGRSCLEAEDS